jgi:hypothetical protein
MERWNRHSSGSIGRGFETMALSKDEIAEIKDGVNKAKKKAMAFAFAKKRKDGGKDPILEIDLKESMVKKTIKAIGAPPLMWGSLQMINKQTMAFVVDKGKPKEIQQAINKTLKKAHPMLGKAQVLTREQFDSEQSPGSKGVGPPKAFEAKVINCWEPDGKTWELILTGGEAHGIEKKMTAVVNYLGQSCKGKVIDVYPTRCKIRVEAPVLGDKNFPASDFESIIIGTAARGKYPSPAKLREERSKPPKSFESKLVSVRKPGDRFWNITVTGGDSHSITERMPAVMNYKGNPAQSCKGTVIDVYPTRCKLRVEVPALGEDATLSTKAIESIFVGTGVKAKYPTPDAVRQTLEDAKAARAASEEAAAKLVEENLAKADPQHANFQTLMRQFQEIDTDDARGARKWLKKLQAYVKGRKVPRPRGYGAAEVVVENLAVEKKFIEDVYGLSQDNPHGDEAYAEYIQVLARTRKAIGVNTRHLSKAKTHLQKFDRH